MDTDISHAVEERLAAIEARLDALEGNPVEEDEPEVEQPDVIEDTPQPRSYRGRRGTTVEETVTETTE
jgi:hypothetical protein